MRCIENQTQLFVQTTILARLSKLNKHLQSECYWTTCNKHLNNNYHYSFTKTQKSIWLIIVKIRKRNAWISGENVNITWYDKFSKFCSFVTERIFEHFLNVSVLNNIIFVKHDISSWQYRLHMKSKFKKNGKSWNTQKFQSRQLYTGQFAVIKNN